MKGLCHVCLDSQVEVTLDGNIAICEKCMPEWNECKMQNQERQS